MQNKLQVRAAQLFAEHQVQLFKQTNRLLAWLMIFQWAAGIAAAIWISPKTWSGQFSDVHFHIYVAIFLGGVISLPTAYLGLARSEVPSTRYIIAANQMLTSALLIHLTGGRIETHFHVFGSLAFLAFYRDWTVLVPATIIVAFDHWFRGVYWPQSVYGVLTASPWRWLEHTGWVVFENIILVAYCVRGRAEMFEIANRTAELENTNEVIESKVKERTLELVKANERFENELVERKKLESMIVQSEKMAAIGQLAGGVAHEINNPLGVILGFSQSVVRRLKPGDPLEIPLTAIEREAIRCKNLVQDLLTFSRVNKAGKEIIDLQEAIEGALTLVLAQSKVKNVELTKEFAAGCKISGNRTQIQQIIVNLCNNAMDAMPRGGKLMVSSKKVKSEEREGVEVRVRDTGMGISKEIQSQIFNPFFTTKEAGKGTGLGLSLVYELVAKHDGKISLESEVDQGTEFRVFFPLSIINEK